MNFKYSAVSCTNAEFKSSVSNTCSVSPSWPLLRTIQY